MFREEEHPRGQPDNKGQFVAKSDRRGYDSRDDLNNLPVGQKIRLSKREYGVLRQEVMRKNSAQKGKVKPTNFAYTSNYFYVYSTSGDDDFSPIVQLNIEKDREEINQHLRWFREKRK